MARARACTAAQTPANILIVLTLVMFRRWEVASRSALGNRRGEGEERTLRGTSGAMLACLGVPACVFKPAALLQRGHVRFLPRRPPILPTTATRAAHPNPPRTPPPLSQVPPHFRPPHFQRALIRLPCVIPCPAHCFWGKWDNQQVMFTRHLDYRPRRW